MALPRSMMKNSKFTVDLDSLRMSRIHHKQSVDVLIDAGVMEIAIKAAGFWSWDGKPDVLIRAKNTEQWQPLSMEMLHNGVDQEFGFAATPWFSSMDNGVALVELEKSDKLIIAVSNDGGQSWTRTDHTLPKDYCSHTYPEFQQVLLIGCNGANGDFYESTDNGKTWQHVREHEEF